jgi:phage tail sheath protein FI
MVAVSYPGVYIEEVQSAVRTVTGVATSITAFVGRALRGPTNEPLLLTSIADFQREYGGLWTQSPMSYAVHQFHQNGGALAVIVRLVHTPESDMAVAATSAKLIVIPGTNPWTFEAATEGSAGSALVITTKSASDAPEDAGRFDVHISDGSTVEVVRMAFAAGRYWYDIEDPEERLLSGSPLGTGLVTVEGTVPSVRPVEVERPLEGGTDAAFATATVDGVPFTAATIGVAGNSLVADVLDASDATQPGNYNLLVTRLDWAGSVVASELFENVVPAGPWPSPTSDGTDVLLDTSANVPAQRPANGRAAFVGGADLGKATATIELAVVPPVLTLEAANEGAWGNSLQAFFDDETSEDATQAPADPNHKLFNLTVMEVRKDAGADPLTPPIELARETFRNVSLDPEHARFVENVLAEESKLVRLIGSAPRTRPEVLPDTWFSFVGGHDGEALQPADYLGTEVDKSGISALEKIDLFNLLVIPPPVIGGETDVTVWQSALTYCKRRRAILLVDAPTAWKDAKLVEQDATSATGFFSDIQGADATNAAIYWPPIKVADPLREYRIGEFTPSGAIAGVIARTDAERGVWKAPAGLEASLTGVRGLSVSPTDLENGRLNPNGINVLRTFAGTGTVVWGARTLRGSDKLASQWKYLPVRRLALFIEESLYRGTKWAVFEPNDEPLWAQLRLNIGAFMQNLFRQGAFQGSAPREAYLVKCDRETTTQNDIDRGIVNVMVGFAPLKPAEFVVIRISQLAGQ